tara:strand:+ start:2380 stop:2553 length:174 start_codon:yes stop_codon:yes gene_type:complete
MIKKIMYWASMQKTTYHEMGIFNISLTGPANYVGWTALAVKLIMLCSATVFLKMIFS